MGPKAFFHLLAVGAYAYTAYYDYNLVKGELLPIHHQPLSRFVWLTLVDLYLQLFYHFIGFVVAIFGGKHPIFHFLSRVIVGPVGMTVVMLFWALYTFDPNTLLADDMAKQILSIVWYNNSLHTLPLITTILDTLIWNHGQPSNKKAIKAIGIFAVLYVIDIHVVHHISGFWAYPILGELALPFRGLFIIACMGVLFVNYKILDMIHVAVHGVQKKERKRQ